MQLFLEEDEAEERSKIDIYASALIAEMRRSWVVHKDKVSNNDFLISRRAAPVAPKKELTEEEKEKFAQNKLALEKAHWGIIAGKIGKNRKYKPKPKPREPNVV